ncbi:response regulator transcription factor [Motiliproteus sp. SC1-56]|uniref:response regulator n=1 Tax=Motiliproteus sp. SC1-56 TaxID=2799565 RepID=UPI001A8E4377|nr:response regulator transcription factor [Motiliproteus sp. SC1-56]
MIVDPHPASREGLAWRISQQSKMSVCAEAKSIEQALEQLEQSRPDAVVIEMNLSDGSGLTLVRQIKSRNYPVAILLWAASAEPLYAERAIRAGALGFICKTQSTQEVVEAIRTVARHQLYLDEALFQELLSRSLNRSQDHKTHLADALSNRELEIFTLIGQGLATRTIAQRLSISPNTVETHRSRIKQKLHLKSGAELTTRASRWLLERDPP